VLGNVFFNVAIGHFEGNLQGLMSCLQINKVLFEEKEKQINLLELQIQELTNLIKKQKERIVNAYLYFPPEKELLQELIKTYLKFTKLKSKKIYPNEHDNQYEEYEEKYRNIKKKLRKKLNKEEKNEMERILSYCEELAT
jgi:hypothetical protein